MRMCVSTYVPALAQCGGARSKGPDQERGHSHGRTPRRFYSHTHIGMAVLQAGTKPVARITRYEALVHRLDTLELALHHQAMGKYRRSAGLLVQVGGKAAVMGLRAGVNAFLGVDGVATDGWVVNLEWWW